ncbi:hypothetical protein RUM43_012229 [Polyplax serrata]|uniref:Uncharacterized protein n=1 Tax=Polyplax serrata TaxID=468196 RepID=A0AAN8PD54_POLSC
MAKFQTKESTVSLTRVLAIRQRQELKRSEDKEVKVAGVIQRTEELLSEDSPDRTRRFKVGNISLKNSE